MNPKSSFKNRFRSKLRGIKPSAARDNSTCKLQCTVFLKLGSHYNLPIPIRFALGIGVSRISLKKMPWNILLPMALPLIFGVMGRSFPAHAHAHLFVRAYGQTLSKVCHHQFLLTKFTDIYATCLFLFNL